MHQQNRLYSCGSMKVLALLFALFFAVTTVYSSEKKPSVNDIFFITAPSERSLPYKGPLNYTLKLEVTHRIYWSSQDADAISVEFMIKNKSVSDIVISEKDVRASCTAAFQKKRVKSLKEIPYYFGCGESLMVSGKFPILLKSGESTTFCVTKDYCYLNRFIIDLYIFKEIDYSVDFKRKKPIITAAEGDTAIQNARDAEK